MPKVWIDENVLQKDSPIYQNGQYLVYQGALTLKEEVAGKNANYCYAPEDKRYTAKGNVILEETDPNPENIKIRARYGKCVYDSKRKVYRISKGAILEAQPTKRKRIQSDKRITASLWRRKMEFCDGASPKKTGSCRRGQRKQKFHMKWMRKHRVQKSD